MKREIVKSSSIVSVGYDAGKKVLEIEFIRGGLYSYPDVPEDIFVRLMNSDSKGKFFTSEIRDVYNSERLSTLERVTGKLTKEQKRILLDHFNSIYECSTLTQHEFKITYLAWLWANGLVYREQSGMSTFEESEAGVPLTDYEITFEDENTGGVNLDLMYSYYGLDEIVHLMKWK